jgi:hypothetical protein
MAPELVTGVHLLSSPSKAYERLWQKNQPAIIFSAGCRNHLQRFNYLHRFKFKTAVQWQKRKRGK